MTKNFNFYKSIKKDVLLHLEEFLEPDRLYLKNIQTLEDDMEHATTSKENEVDKIRKAYLTAEGDALIDKYYSGRSMARIIAPATFVLGFGAACFIHDVLDFRDLGEIIANISIIAPPVGYLIFSQVFKVTTLKKANRNSTKYNQLVPDLITNNELITSLTNSIENIQTNIIELKNQRILLRNEYNIPAEIWYHEEYIYTKLLDDRFENFKDCITYLEEQFHRHKLEKKHQEIQEELEYTKAEAVNARMEATDAMSKAVDAMREATNARMLAEDAVSKVNDVAGNY